MRNILEPVAKTIPSNYRIIPEDQSLPGAEVPGFSCTAEAWAKAERQESEYYDWEGYENCQIPKVEHPAYIERAKYEALVEAWEEVLRRLEPIGR